MQPMLNNLQLMGYTTVRKYVSLWLALVWVSLLRGCATPVGLPAIPVDHTTKAVAPGILDARYWVDAELEPIV
jgi:hypothetical protein